MPISRIDSSWLSGARYLALLQLVSGRPGQLSEVLEELRVRGSRLNQLHLCGDFSLRHAGMHALYEFLVATRDPT